jgi:probable phosphoglycerate mutase
MERVILARHGESEYSVRGAANGDPTVVVALTDEGRAQARRLGEALAGEPVDLAVVTEFQRTRETAELALAGRDVPLVVVPALNDIRLGSFEGCQLDEYRSWARSCDPDVEGPGGAESRAAVARRYVQGFRTVLARPEETILVVAHGLPIRYILNAAAGRSPEPFVEMVEYAAPHRFERAELEAAVDLLARWAAAPRWAA